MTELYRASHYALYAQVAIWDAEETDSYPDDIADAPVTFGARGVVVATAPDVDVELVIFRDEEPEGSPVGTGSIRVGGAGLDVGNLVAADVGHLDWPAGELRMRVYTDAPPDEASLVKILFE